MFNFNLMLHFYCKNLKGSQAVLWTPTFFYFLLKCSGVNIHNKLDLKWFLCLSTMKSRYFSPSPAAEAASQTCLWSAESFDGVGTSTHRHLRILCNFSKGKADTCEGYNGDLSVLLLSISFLSPWCRYTELQHFLRCRMVQIMLQRV